MHQGDDQRVISEVLAGESDAYAVLVERYQKPIFNLMYRMTGSYGDALDLAQETFLKAFEQLHRFKQDKRFFPWLYTIGLNHSKNFLRQDKSSRNAPVEECDFGCVLGDPRQEEEKMVLKLDSLRIHKALQQLPFDYREAVVLRYHEDLSMEEVSTALGISLSGAKMRVHRGIRKLREILEGNEDGPQGKSTSA